MLSLCFFSRFAGFLSGVFHKQWFALWVSGILGVRVCDFRFRALGLDLGENHQNPHEDARVSVLLTAMILMRLMAVKVMVRRSEIEA